MNVLLGTQFYAGGADANRRQAAAAASMRALAGVEPVNVQWRDEVFDVPGIDTLAALERDARRVAGSPGPRKPILADIFDVLAAEARRRGLRRFAFANSDIIVLPAAIDAIGRENRQTCAFSRMDFERTTGRDLRIVTTGLDMFVMEVDWWSVERRRFRPYVLSEWIYDCVFGAIMMTFSDGVILNRHGEIRHERHAHGAPDLANPSAVLNSYLGALDSRLFSLWAAYHFHLDRLRASGASEADERMLLRETFRWRRSAPAAVRQVGRSVRARWRYRRHRAAAIARAAAAPR